FEEARIHTLRGARVTDAIDRRARGLVQELPGTLARERELRGLFEQLDDALGVALFVVDAEQFGERPLDVLARVGRTTDARRRIFTVALRARPPRRRRDRRVLFGRRPPLGRELEQAVEDVLRERAIDDDAGGYLCGLAQELGIAARRLREPQQAVDQRTALVAALGLREAGQGAEGVG